MRKAWLQAVQRPDSSLVKDSTSIMKALVSYLDFLSLLPKDLMATLHRKIKYLYFYDHITWIHESELTQRFYYQVKVLPWSSAI